MSSYPKMTITNNGLEAIGQSAADGAALIFTRVELGDGQITTETLTEMTALISKKLDVNLSSGSYASGTAKMRFTVVNTNLDAGFFAREIGLYAKVGADGTEILYAYTNGGNYVDYIPDKTNPIDAQIVDIYVTTANAANVTIIADGAGGVDEAKVNELISTHNTSTTAHQDIRDLIANVKPTGAATYFYTDGEYTVPAGVTTLYISGCAGGAGGGVCGGGGGGQSTYRQAITVTAGEKIAITVGAGGAGVLEGVITATTFATTGLGGDGGNTSVGSYLLLKGGKHAYGNNSLFSAPTLGMAGGAGATNGETWAIHSFTSSQVNYKGGAGGSSTFGRGGSGGFIVPNNSYSAVSSRIAGSAGVGFGAGGGGAAFFNAGSANVPYSASGAGSNGVVIIETA